MLDMELQAGSEQGCDTLRWYAIQTHPQQEERANSNLRAWKVETFSPTIRVVRRTAYVRPPSYEIKPLFPRYIFARFDVNTMLRNVWYTRGVSSVVCCGVVPAEVDDEIISLIRSHETPEGFIEIGESLRIGDTVTIENGPFRGLEGILEREVKAADRVVILLSTISYQGNVVIDKEHVKRVSSLKKCA